MIAPALHISGRLEGPAGPLIAGFDVTFAAGRWNVLLGPSGVGKTSLLRLIADLPCPARLTGEIVASDGAARAPRVAMMAQDDQLLPWADALGNVVIGARLRGARPDVQRGRALLAEVGLAAQEKRRPAELSAGQRQRVVLARTLYEERPIVLLDEPFSALDVLTRHHMQDLAARLLAGRTVVLITHDPAEAARLAHHAWIATRAGIVPCSLPPSPPPRNAEAQETLAVQARLSCELKRCATEVPA